MQAIEERERIEGVEGFYPLCTTSINVTKRLCDLCQLSKPRQGPVTKLELDRLLASASTVPASPLWVLLTDANSFKVSSSEASPVLIRFNADAARMRLSRFPRTFHEPEG